MKNGHIIKVSKESVYHYEFTQPVSEGQRQHSVYNHIVPMAYEKTLDELF